MQRTKRIAELPYCFGKKPAVLDSRTLRFGKYLSAKVPAPPKAINWGKNVRQWPMYSNDKYADCTCAAAAHMIENWSAARGTPRIPTNAQVMKFYKHFTTPGPDNNCDVLGVLKYWRSQGLADDKILAFAEIDRRNVNEAKHVIAIFGGCYVGLQLPKFAGASRNPAIVPWVARSRGLLGNAAPDPRFGHCVAAFGYDSQNLYVVSWGAIKSMSWQFYMDYADETYAVLSKDFLSKNKAPSGFDLDQLELDLMKVTKIPSKLVTGDPK
jgi:hypothetical protein